MVDPVLPVDHIVARVPGLYDQALYDAAHALSSKFLDMFIMMTGGYRL